MHLSRERTTMGDMATGAPKYIWRKPPALSETRARAFGPRRIDPPFLFWEHLRISVMEILGYLKIRGADP